MGREKGVPCDGSVYVHRYAVEWVGWNSGEEVTKWVAGGNPPGGSVIEWVAVPPPKKRLGTTGVSGEWREGRLTPARRRKKEQMGRVIRRKERESWWRKSILPQVRGEGGDKLSLFFPFPPPPPLPPYQICEYVAACQDVDIIFFILFRVSKFILQSLARKYTVQHSCSIMASLQRGE